MKTLKNKNILKVLILVLVSSLFFAGCTGDKEKDLEDKSTESVENEDIKEEDQEEAQVEELELEKLLEEYNIVVNEDTIEYTDDTDEELVLDKKPERVVVLFSSFIDMWVKNGGDLVGMVEDELVHDVPGLENVVGVGRTGAMSLEKIIELDPDLVIVSAGSSPQLEMIPGLRENDIDVLALEYKFKDDYYRIATLFSALNEREDLFEENVVAVEKEIQEILEMIPEEDISAFIMMASSKSISSRDSESTLGEMLKDLGVRNIADTDKAFEDANFSLEKIIEEDPDFIFVQTRGSDMDAVEERLKDEVESNPAWKDLKAVEEDKYIVLPKELYLYKANDQYAEAYRGLAEILYPEVFNK